MMYVKSVQMCKECVKEIEIKCEECMHVKECPSVKS